MESSKPTSENRSFMHSSYGDNKWNKSKELNASMSVAERPADSYEDALKSLGGNV